MTLSRDELKYYQRQLLLPEMGMEGQTRLKNSKVLVIGAGGLGCPVLQYLTSAGVGILGIVDHDTISESNLHRQILYQHDEIGTLKTEAAIKKLTKLNPFITVTGYPTLLEPRNATELIEPYHIVIDATDNFTTRYLINDTCEKLNRPLVYGSVQQHEGQMTVFHLADKNGIVYNLRDIFRHEPSDAVVANCAQTGILGAVAGWVGTAMAIEALKIILSPCHATTGELLMFDSKQMTIDKFKIVKIKIDSLLQEQTPKHLEPSNNYDLSPEELKSWVDDKTHDFRLIDIREEDERMTISLGGDHLPLSLFDTNNDQISKNETVVIYCQHGQRSKHLRNYLANELNYNNLYHLHGGVVAWVRIYGRQQILQKEV